MEYVPKTRCRKIFYPTYIIYPSVAADIIPINYKEVVVMLKLICGIAGSFLGRAVGDMICPGIGGQIGAQLGTFAGGSYGNIASDPANWAAGLAYKAECIETLGFDPTDFF